MPDRLADGVGAVVADVVVLQRDHVHAGRLKRADEPGPAAEEEPGVVVRAGVDQRRLEVDDRQISRGRDVLRGRDRIQEVVAALADGDVGVARGDDVAGGDQRADARWVELERREVARREDVREGERWDRRRGWRWPRGGLARRAGRRYWAARSVRSRLEPSRRPRRPRPQQRDKEHACDCCRSLTTDH